MTTTTTIRVRDLTSGDVHDLPATTPCMEVAYGSVRDAIELPYDPSDLSFALRACKTGDVVYVRSDDPGEADPDARLWWRSEVIGAEVQP